MKKKRMAEDAEFEGRLRSHKWMARWERLYHGQVAREIHGRLYWRRIAERGKLRTASCIWCQHGGRTRKGRDRSAWKIQNNFRPLIAAGIRDNPGRDAKPAKSRSSRNSERR